MNLMQIKTLCVSNHTK